MLISCVLFFCYFASAEMYDSKVQAYEALTGSLFGETENLEFSASSHTPPLKKKSAIGGTLPVTVKVQVFVERIQIDSQGQEATLKWWLRQTWKDERLAWNVSHYQYPDEDGNAVGITKITRGDGFWKPDTVVFESRAHFQMNAFGSDRFLAEIDSEGGIFFSQPQEVTVHMSPRMNMSSFPFDYENVTFSIGSWSSTTEQIDYQFFDNGFIALPGFDCLYKAPPRSNDVQNNPWGSGLACKFDGSTSEAKSDVNSPRWFTLSEEWDLRAINQLRMEKIYVETTEANAVAGYAELNGKIALRRHSEVKLGRSVCC